MEFGGDKDATRLSTESGQDRQRASSSQDPRAMEDPEMAGETGVFKPQLEEQDSDAEEAAAALIEGMSLVEMEAAEKEKAKNRKASKRWRAKKEAARKAAKRDAREQALSTNVESSSADLVGSEASPSKFDADQLFLLDSVLGKSLLHMMANQEESGLQSGAPSFSRGQQLPHTDQESLRLTLQEKEHAVQQMLFEFKRLGKVQEANLKRPLNEIASFSMVPGGYKKNKEEVLRLCETVVDSMHGGPRTAKDQAILYLGSGLKMHPAWESMGSLTYPEVLKAFEAGLEHQTFVDIPSAVQPAGQRMSLEAITQLNVKVANQYYILLMTVVQGQLSKVLPDTADLETQEQRIIARATAAAAIFSGTWIIGQSTKFVSMRAIKAPPPTGPRQAEGVRKIFASLSPEQRAELWQHWDEFCAASPPVISRLAEAEDSLDTCLKTLDVGGESALLLLMHAVSKLMVAYNDLFHHSFLLDMRSCFVCSPLQMGLLGGLQMPDLPYESLLQSEEWDPYFRWSAQFSSGTIARQ